MKWIPVRQYSEKHNLSTPAIYKRIKKGTLESKKIKGAVHVLDTAESDSESSPDDAEINQINDSYQMQLKEKTRLDNELKQEKLANLKQDTLLKKQKNDFIKQKYRLEYAEGVLECFTESFSDLKNFLISLKFNQQEKEKFNQSFAGCLKKFRKQLEKYLKEKNIENEEIK